MVLLLLLFLVSSVAGVEVLPPDDEEFCLGSIANWTCTLNGSIIGWIYDTSDSHFYFTNDTNVTLLGSGPFRTGPTTISGGVSTSMATANLSSNALNGTMLECSDGGTNSSNVSLNLKDSMASTSVAVQFDETNGRINITWSGAICVPYYRVVVNNVVEDTVSGTSFSYTPPSRGFYSFQINSIDYFGREIGCIANSTSAWIPPTTMINIEFAHSMDLVVSFQDNNIGQPPINYCEITVNNDSRPCQINQNYTFPIRDGGNYTYNVTVCNVVGSINETGNVRVLKVPTTVFASLPTTVFVSLPTTVFVSVTETVAPTVIPSCSATGDPTMFAAPFIVLAVLIIMSVGWIMLRICWKRQCCCPRIWRSSFWLLFFCYDCCTYNAGEKENDSNLNNSRFGGEKRTDTSL